MRKRDMTFQHNLVLVGSGIYATRQNKRVILVFRNDPKRIVGAVGRSQEIDVIRDRRNPLRARILHLAASRHVDSERATREVERLRRPLPVPHRRHQRIRTAAYPRRCRGRVRPRPPAVREDQRLAIGVEIDGVAAGLGNRKSGYPARCIDKRIVAARLRITCYIELCSFLETERAFDNDCRSVRADTRRSDGQRVADDDIGLVGQGSRPLLGKRVEYHLAGSPGTCICDRSRPGHDRCRKVVRRIRQKAQRTVGKIEPRAIDGQRTVRMKAQKPLVNADCPSECVRLAGEMQVNPVVSCCAVDKEATGARHVASKSKPCPVVPFPWLFSSVVDPEVAVENDRANPRPPCFVVGIVVCGIIGIAVRPSIVRNNKRPNRL